MNELVNPWTHVCLQTFQWCWLLSSFQLGRILVNFPCFYCEILCSGSCAGRKVKKIIIFKQAVPNLFGTRDQFLVDNFSMNLLGVWFWDDSSALHLLCSLFLLLFYQLHLRSAGIRSWRLGTPDLSSLFGLNDGNLGMTEDEMVGWHHWLNGHEFEQTPGDGEGQESLVCCLPLDCKELDTIEW